MSRRRRRALSPSLFPFLAVLVCTLGTLILMLALVATGATTPIDAPQPDAQGHAAAQDNAARNDAAESLAAAKQIAGEAEFRLTQLIEFRDAQTADAENRRGQLTHLESHTRQIQDQLQRLNAEVVAALADSGASSGNANDDQKRLDDLNTKIAAATESLADARQRIAAGRRRVVIVPHRGKNGTTRRPIYIECTADGVTIWPEGIDLSMDQLAAAAGNRNTPDANALDVALRTARQHAMKSYGDADPPYPMLVVRPDGIDAYGIARTAMTDWDDQYGYELLPADVQLAFPAADPLLAKQLRTVIATADAAARRSLRSRLAGRGRGNLDSYASPGRPPKPSSGKTPRVISAADLTRRGGLTGFRPDNEFRVRRDALRSSDPLAKLPPARNRFDNNRFAGDRFAGTDAAGFQPNQSSALDQRDGGTAIDALAQLHQGDPNAPSTPTDLSNQPLHRGGQAAAADESHSGPPAAQNHLAAQNQLAAENQLAGDFNAAGTQSDPWALSDPSADANASSGQPGGTSAATAMMASDPPPPNQDVQNDNARPGDTPQPLDRLPPPGARADDSDAPPPNFDRSGDGWALPSNVRHGGTNEIVRTMPVHVTADSITIGNQTLPIDPANPSHVHARVVLAAQQTMRRWGPALAGGRWQPRITATVDNGGSLRCDQLQRYLERSGIEFVRKPIPR